MFILYPFMVFFDLVILIASVLIFNWIVVLFEDKDGNLPKLLKYFQTFDSPLPMVPASGPIDGWPRLTRYLAGAEWLLRNPCYGFDLYVFGMGWKKERWTVRFYSSTPDRDIFFATSVLGGFNFYYQGNWSWATKTIGGTYKFGWKAWNCFDRSTGELSGTFGDGTHIPICITFSPIKTKASSA